jgi:aspartyl aminopeptidase
VRNDCPCGTTIGPIIASKTGLRVVDLGVPSLSMHSIRETVGVTDIDTSMRLFSTFLTSFPDLDAQCTFHCKPCTN